MCLCRCVHIHKHHPQTDLQSPMQKQTHAQIQQIIHILMVDVTVLSGHIPIALCNQKTVGAHVCLSCVCVSVHTQQLS